MIDVIITPNNIRSFSQKLRQLIGEAFFDDNEKLALSNKPSNRDTYSLNYQEHPLYTRWKSFLLDIEKSERFGKLFLSNSSRDCIALYIHLSTIQNIPNFSRILLDITTNDKYYSSVYEAKVAFEYVRQGYKVTIQDETGATSGRVSDFIISIDDQELHVECKSLDVIEEVEQNNWNELRNRTLSLLNKYARNWNIAVNCSKEIDANDVNQICTILKRCIKNGDLEDVNLFDNTIQIFIKETAIELTDDLRNMMTITSDESGEHGTYAFDDQKFAQIALDLSRSKDQEGNTILATLIKFGEFGELEFKSICNVTVFPYSQHHQHDVTDRLISNIKRASKQIPKDKSGIVHLAIPCHISNHFFEIIDNCYDNIYNLLEKNHSRINAVTLYGEFYDKQQNGLVTSINYVIPNPNPKLNLPKNFKTLDTHIILDSNIDCEGTVCFVYKFANDWLPNSIETLTSVTSPNGLTRVAVYYLAGNYVRFEVRSPALRRKYITSDTPVSMPLNERIIFIGRWTNKRLQMKLMDKNEITFSEKELTYV